MIYIGCDPGQTGGFAALDGNTYDLHKTPSKNGVIDLHALCALLSKFEGEVWVEDVHSIFGSAAKANFSFGFNVGALHQALACAGIAFNLVQPKAWQAVVWRPTDIVYKTPRVQKFYKNGLPIQTVDTKKTSYAAALRIYPDINTKHDGVIDALLIATYAKMIA